MNSFLKKSNIGVDFSSLEGAFVRDTILPHDLDGIVEVNGKFLILECKQEGEELSEGQKCSLQMLARERNKLILEVRLSGRRGIQGAFLFDPVAYRCIKSDGFGDWEDTNLEKFKELCANWSGRRRPMLEHELLF